MKLIFQLKTGENSWWILMKWKIGEIKLEHQYGEAENTDYHASKDGLDLQPSAVSWQDLYFVGYKYTHHV